MRNPTQKSESQLPEKESLGMVVAQSAPRDGPGLHTTGELTGVRPTVESRIRFLSGYAHLVYNAVICKPHHMLPSLGKEVVKSLPVPIQRLLGSLSAASPILLRQFPSSAQASSPKSLLKHLFP